MDVSRLRSDTRPEHEAVEAAMPLMDPALTVERYIAVLQTLYRLIASWEAFSAQHAPARLSALVASRRRAPSLAADLQTFGATRPPVPAFPATELMNTVDRSEAAFLGAMYVIEGSTLGGQFIAKHLIEHFQAAPIPVTEAAGATYFRGAGDHTGSLWKEFQAELRALPDEDADTTIAAARSMFTLFRRALLEPAAA